jgi:hypothetical protein
MARKILINKTVKMQKGYGPMNNVKFSPQVFKTAVIFKMAEHGLSTITQRILKISAGILDTDAILNLTKTFLL